MKSSGQRFRHCQAVDKVRGLFKIICSSSCVKFYFKALASSVPPELIDRSHCFFQDVTDLGYHLLLYDYNMGGH